MSEVSPRIKTPSNMKPINVIIGCLLAATLLTGCVDDVNIENYGETRKLVLYCRLCPQMDSTYILLSHSQLIYGQDNTDSPNITDGTVELSADGSHWIRATYDSLRQRYLITREEFPVVEGGTYHIRASYPGFEDVSSTCTVPLSHDVGFRFDTVATDGDLHWGEPYYWPHKDVYAEWRDVAGEENAYAIGHRYLLPIHVMYDDGEDTFYEWRFDLDWMTDDNTDCLYISDKGRDGQVIRILHDVDLYNEYEGEGWKDDDEGQRFLFFLDRNCYQYEMTLPNDDFGMLTFLFLEPEHTYTNIKNGFGLFGAFSMLEIP